MGKLVNLDSEKRARSRRRSDGKVAPSKTALVLGGGGFTGALYEIGALKAFDLLLTNSSVNSFDIYVGTSAGSFVTSMLANGITSEEMMQVVDGKTSEDLRPFGLDTMLKPDYKSFANKLLLQLPVNSAKVAANFLRNFGQVSAIDALASLSHGMPAGFYHGKGIEEYMRWTLSRKRRSNDFRKLAHELYIVATDIDHGERLVFGSEGWDDVPISKAVQASTALPVVYKPVEVKGHKFIDGAVLYSTHLDLAVQAGADLVVVVNPLVPYISDTVTGGKTSIADRGMSYIGHQTFKMIAYHRMHELSKHWDVRYPGVDIVLIEPELDDSLMYDTSMMNFSSRVDVARNGFQSVTLKLAENYERYQALSAQHGLDISADRVNKVVETFASKQEDNTRAWRKILEQTTSTLLRQAGR